MGETAQDRFDRLVRSVNRHYNKQMVQQSSNRISFWKYLFHSLRHVFTPSGLEAMQEQDMTFFHDEGMSEREQELVLQASDWKRALEKLRTQNKTKKIPGTMITVQEEIEQARTLYENCRQEFLQLQQEKKKL